MASGYDLAVIGDQLGGLTAAALAARRGSRVLVLESSVNGAQRSFEHLNALAGGPEAVPGLGRLFQELGLAPFGPLGDDRIHFHALSPPLQLCLSRHRVSLHPDRTARAWELQREFGDAPRQLAALWQREEELREKIARVAPQPGEPAIPLPMRALASVTGLVRLQALERETAQPGFAAFLDGLALPSDLRATLAAQAQAVARRPSNCLGWAEGLQALRVANGGLYRNVAGLTGVLVGLRATLLSTGGDLRPLVALEGLDLPRTGGLRLHLAAGGTVRADRAIVDLPLAEVQRLLPAEVWRALSRKGLEERSEQAYGLIEMTLAPGRLPAAMGGYVAIAPEGEDPAAAAVLLAASDEAEDGTRAIEALGFFTAGEADGARERLLGRVRTILPFLDESLVGSPDYHGGVALRFSQRRLGRAQRAERLAVGCQTAIFHQPPFTFLRNEDYASVGLTEGLLSGLVALAS